ncbi:MAG: hypothetical protein OXC93_04210 [Rhodospirillaceae bacterium]|nr:hypothetical protein [Rhodospirillaceae bacterium]
MEPIDLEGLFRDLVEFLDSPPSMIEVRKVVDGDVVAVEQGRSEMAGGGAGLAADQPDVAGIKVRAGVASGKLALRVRS